MLNLRKYHFLRLHNIPFIKFRSSLDVYQLNGYDAIQNNPSENKKGGVKGGTYNKQV